MNAHRLSIHRWKLAVSLSAAGLVALALLVLVGWATGRLPLGQPLARPNFLSACGLMLWGLALFSLARSWGRPAQLLGMALLLLGAVGAVCITGLDDGHIGRWIDPDNARIALASPGGLYAAESFTCMLAGLVCLVAACPNLPGRAAISACVGAAIITCGIALLTGLQPGNGGPIRPLVACAGALVGGAAILVHAFRLDERPLWVGQLLPMAIGVAGVIASLMFFQALNERQNVRFQRMMQLETADIHRRIEESLKGRIGTLSKPDDGGLHSLLQLQELLDASLHDVGDDYAIRVAQGDETLYSRSDGDVRYRQNWEHSRRLNLPGLNWTLHVWPTSAAMSRESQPATKSGLVAGLLATLLLIAGSELALTSRWRAREVEQREREREQAETLRLQSEVKYRSLIENLEQEIFLKDREGRYLAVNHSFCDTIGRSEQEIIGKTDADLFGDEQAQAQRQAEEQVLVEGKKIVGDLEKEIAGSKRIVHRILTPARDSQGAAVGVLGICLDVTDQRAIEAKVRQAGKMDAIGQLAGGIAHDFNNLLTAILGNLELLLLNSAGNERNREFILSAQNAANRAASLTNRLLGFSRQHHLDWQPTDLNGIVDEVVTLLSRTIDPRVRLETHKCSDLWPVQADPGQINQVLMNLCLNARDAIVGAGKIFIETACVEIDDVEALAHFDARHGSFVRLRITDTGAGMSAEVMSRIFEPFFTTKAVGKGTGLGLAMVFAIVKQHKGWIECYSEMGCGSQFDIFLPRAAAAAKQSASPPDAPRPTRQGNETILVVDDEPMIRRLALFALQRQGYTVLEAEDGQQAVELYEREKQRIDLVLLDLTMPKLSGQEAFRRMLQLNPQVKVLFTSGYAAEQIVDPEMEEVFGFVKKPFRPDDLVRSIQEALEKERAAAPATRQRDLTAAPERQLDRDSLVHAMVP